jgi:hypothetical protein
LPRGGWRLWLYRFITTVYFERITLVHPDRLPGAGAVLYLGLHRNGAVDGFVYDRVLRNPVFMISTQLRKNWFARLFFQGIAVTRTKDEWDRALNDAAFLALCVIGLIVFAGIVQRNSATTIGTGQVCLSETSNCPAHGQGGARRKKDASAVGVIETW